MNSLKRSRGSKKKFQWYYECRETRYYEELMRWRKQNHLEMKFH